MASGQCCTIQRTTARISIILWTAVDFSDFTTQDFHNSMDGSRLFRFSMDGSILSRFHILHFDHKHYVGSTQSTCMTTLPVDMSLKQRGTQPALDHTTGEKG